MLFFVIALHILLKSTDRPLHEKDSYFILGSISIVYEKQKKVKPVWKNRRRMQLSQSVCTPVCILCLSLRDRGVQPFQMISFCLLSGRFYRELTSISPYFSIDFVKRLQNNKENFPNDIPDIGIKWYNRVSDSLHIRMISFSLTGPFPKLRRRSIGRKNKHVNKSKK